MTRTIVVSDPHGDNSVIDTAVDAEGLSAADTLVIAGDLIDVGGDDTLARAEELGAVVLAGNHEICAMLGVPIRPQNPGSLALAPLLAERFTSGAWKLAHAADGWLITHAGVSSALDDVIDAAGRDAESVAAALNARFAEEVTDAVERAPLTWDGLERYRLLGGGLGPLWFRPRGAELLARGLRQVAGHTPPEMFPPAVLAQIESCDWRLIEPGGHLRTGASTRWAVIKNGSAQVRSA